MTTGFTTAPAGASTVTTARTEVWLRPTANTDVKARVQGYADVTFTNGVAGAQTLRSLANADVTATHEISPEVKTYSGSVNIPVSTSYVLPTGFNADANITSFFVTCLTGDQITLTHANGNARAYTVGQSADWAALSEGGVTIATTATSTALLQVTYESYAA